MNAASTSRRPVDVFGAVRLDGPAGRIEVEGKGNAVAVRTAGWSPVGTVTAPLLRLDRAERSRQLTRLQQLLAHAGLELGFYIDDVEVARMGRGMGLGLLARGLALPGLRFRITGLLRSLIRSPFVRR